MARSELGRARGNIDQNERLISIGVGALLAIIGLRRSIGSLLVTLLGGYLVYRGVTGHCKVYEVLDIDTRQPKPGGRLVTGPLAKGITVERTVTVNRSPAEVYLFWRNLENLPRFMEHLESVTVINDKRSHWVATAPIGGIPLEWDAEITDLKENESIAWGSLAGSRVMTTGEVTFHPAPGERGTEVQARIEYKLPGGPAGAGLAKLLNKVVSQSVKEDLRRFKEVMEAGETPTVDGQPSGRAHLESAGRREAPTSPSSAGSRARPAHPAQGDVVEKASEDSFPASDPPSYSMGVD